MFFYNEDIEQEKDVKLMPLKLLLDVIVQNKAAYQLEEERLLFIKSELKKKKKERDGVEIVTFP